MLSDAAASELKIAAVRQSAAANTVFAAALVLRETIYEIFSAVAAGKPPPEIALNHLNAEIAAAYRHAHLQVNKAGFRLVLSGDAPDLRQPLLAVVRDCVDLLTSPLRAKVRECAGDRCSWLFLDTTKNHSRLWCDMRGCGNRAKARRHREKHISAGGPQ